MRDYQTSVNIADFHADTRAFFARRRVLVLGGSGFIGSHVVEQLLGLGARPVVVSRRVSPPFLAAVAGQIELIEADLNSPAATRAAFRGCGVALHLAAQVAGLEYNAAHPASIFMANLGPFFNVVHAAVAERVERLLVTSSACVYPRHCSVPTPENEGFLDVPEPTNAGYGWSKRMEEFLGAAAAAEFNLPVAIARPYNAYGPRDNFDPNSSHVIPALIRKASETQTDQFPVWGDGSHSRSFLYVDDFARGILEVAARMQVADAINIGADEEVTIRETAEIIGRLVSATRGRTIRPVFDPQGLTGQPRRRCDTRKAERLLGYRARVSLQDGLERTVRWYVAHENRALSAHAQ
jgi:GDP-L-fucose synthase